MTTFSHTLSTSSFKIVRASHLMLNKLCSWRSSCNTFLTLHVVLLSMQILPWIRILDSSIFTSRCVLTRQHIDPGTNITPYCVFLAWARSPPLATYLHFAIYSSFCFAYFSPGVYSSFVKIYIWSRMYFHLNTYSLLSNVFFKWLSIFHLFGQYVLLTCALFTHHIYPTVTSHIPWPSILQLSAYSTLCHMFLICPRIILLASHSSPFTYSFGRNSSPCYAYPQLSRVIRLTINSHGSAFFSRLVRLL
jgi:hypothetical protein